MKKSKDIIEQTVDNEILVIPIVDGVAQMNQVCCLTQTSALIWKMFSTDVDISVDEIVNKVSEHYNISKSEIENDIFEFIKDMLLLNIIVDGE